VRRGRLVLGHEHAATGTLRARRVDLVRPPLGQVRGERSGLEERDGERPAVGGLAQDVVERAVGVVTVARRVDLLVHVADGRGDRREARDREHDADGDRDPAGDDPPREDGRGEEQREHGARQEQVAGEQRLVAEAEDQERNSPEQAERNRHSRACAREAKREQCRGRAADRERSGEHVDQVAGREPHGAVDALGPPDPVGRRAGLVHRVERVAGGEPVEGGPADGPGEGERSHRPLAPPSWAKPDGVRQREQPRLRPQPAGRREQREDRPPAARGAGLHRRRPEHERQERDVHVRRQRLLHQQRPREQDQREKRAGRASEQSLTEPVRDPAERRERQDRDRLERVERVRPQQRDRRAQRGRERMRRGRVTRIDIGRAMALREVVAPDQRVQRVVIDVPAAVDQPQRQRQGGHGDEACPPPLHRA
jgi:hypothetical protein